MWVPRRLGVVVGVVVVGVVVLVLGSTGRWGTLVPLPLPLPLPLLVGAPVWLVSARWLGTELGWPADVFWADCWSLHLLSGRRFPSPALVYTCTACGFLAVLSLLLVLVLVWIMMGGSPGRRGKFRKYDASPSLPFSGSLSSSSSSSSSSRVSWSRGWARTQRS